MDAEDRNITSKNDGDLESARPAPRRWLRRVLIAAAATLGLTVAALLYLQTPHAFLHVIVPAVGHFVPGELAVGGGRVTLGGRAEMRNFAWRDEAQGLTFNARSLAAQVDVGSFLGAYPLIESLTVDSPKVRIDLARRGRPTAAGEPKPSDIEFMLPGFLERLAIENVAVEIVEGERTLATIENARLTAQDLTPGRKGRIDLRAEALLTGDAFRPVREAALIAAFDTQWGADARTLSWSGRLTARARLESGPTTDTRTTHLLAVADVAGSLPEARRLKTEARIEMKVNEQAVGNATAALDWRPSREAADESLALDVGVSGLRLPAANPWLSGFGAAFAGGSGEGSVKIERAEGSSDFKAALDLSGVSLNVQALGGRTPPLQFHAAFDGNYQNRPNALKLARAEMQLLRTTETLLALRMSDELEIDLAEAREGEARGDSPPVMLTLEFLDIDAADARPWFALVDPVLADRAKSGVFSGTLNAKAIEQGRRIELEGEWHVNDVRIARKAPAADLGPFRAEHFLKANIANLNRIELNQTKRLFLDEQLWVDWQMEGAHEWESRFTDLQFHCEVPAVDSILSKLNIPMQFRSIQFAGGRLKLDGDLRRADRNAAWRSKMTAELGEGEIASPTGSALRPSLSAEMNLDADPELTEMRVESLDVKFDDSVSTRRALLTASGAWPLETKGADAEKANFDLTLRDFNAAPWLELLGYSAGYDLAEVPVNAELAVEFDRVGQSVALEGEERIGPIRLAGSEASREAEAALRREIRSARHALADSFGASAQNGASGRAEKNETRN